MTPLSAKLRALHEAATPGPWREGRHDMISYEGHSGEPFKNVYADDERAGKGHMTGKTLPYTVARGEGGECLENAILIATLRNALPALADLIEAAEAMAEAIENPKCLGCGAFNEPCACAGSQRRAATNKYRAARARLDEVMK